MRKTRGIKSFIIIFLAAALLCCAAGLIMLRGKDRIARADYILDGSDNDSYWTQAVGESTRNNKVTVRLEADWNTYEAVYVPANSYISLDLNGFVVIGMGDDSIFKVDGILEITDSNPDSENKLYNEAGEELTVNGGAVTGGKATYGGGILVNVGGELILSGGSITYNSATYGGGIAANGGSVTINGGSVSDNTAYSGGGVYVSPLQFTDFGGSLALNGGAVSNNTASNGGGIYSSGTMIITDGTVSENSAQNGGGIYSENSLTVNGGGVTDNNADGSGGGIYSGGTLEIGGGKISDNYANNSGGGIYSEGSLTVSGGEVSGNGRIIENSPDGNPNEMLTVSGGGIYASGACKIENGAVTYNYATYGGGIFSNGTVLMEGGEVSHNEAASDGGGVYADSGFEFSGGKISANYSGNDGGGIYAAVRLTVSGGEITGNTADNNGGGIYSNAQLFNEFEGGDEEIEDDEEEVWFNLFGGSVTNNIAKTNGCGIYTDYGLYLKGSVTVTGNNRGATAVSENNLYLSAGGKIQIVGSIEGSQIGVTLGDGFSGAFTQGYAENAEHQYENPAHYFKSANGYAVLSNGEVRISDEQIQWYISYDNGAYEKIDDYGVTFTYGDKTVTGIKLNNTEQEYEASDASTYVLQLIGYNFTIIIEPAELGSAELSAEQFVHNGEEIQPEVTVKDADGNTLGDENYEIEYENNTEVGTATVIITGVTNYTGELTLSFEIIAPEDTVIYTALEWQFRHEDNTWSATSDFRYTGSDLKDRVRVKLTKVIKDESIEEYIFFGDENWEITFGDDNEFTDADDYTLEISPLNGQYIQGITEDDFTALVKINRSKIDNTVVNFATLGSSDGDWTVYVGEGISTPLLDGSEVRYAVANGVATGVSGQSYAYYRKSGADSAYLTLMLNDTVTAYLKSLNEYGVTVNYVGNSVQGSENEEIYTATTTVSIEFTNHYVVTADGNVSSLTIVKQWNIVTAANTLYTYEDVNGFTYDKVEGNGRYEWEYGDDRNSGIFNHVFRPAYGEYAYYTLENQKIDYFERFAIRFTDNVLSFWEYSADYEVGERIRDKFYLYEYLEELSAGDYTLSVYVPAVYTEDTYKQWWLGTVTSDHAVVYAEMNFTFTIKVTSYQLPSAISLVSGSSDRREYTDTKLTISYVYTTEYVGASVQVPTLTVTLKGKELPTGDYTVEILETNGSGNRRAFTLSASENGNLSGTVLKAVGASSDGLPFELTAGTNSFDALSVIGWKYHAYDPLFNIITAKPVAGTVELKIYANNRTELGDDVYADNIDLDQIILDLGKVSYDENGTVDLSDFTDKLNGLDAGVYWLYAEATDSEGIYNSISRTVKFIIIPDDNSWVVLPGVVSWKYLGYDSAVNIISGTPEYGSAEYSIYRQNADKTYTILRFDGISTFSYDKNGNLPNAVTTALKTLEAGTYYLRAHVEGTNNYTGFDEDDKDISLFHPFSVYKYENYWTETPGLSSWKWEEYDPAVNVLTAASASVEEIVIFRISYNNNGATEFLKFGGVFEGGNEFFFIDGEVPEEVRSVLYNLPAGITYTLYARVSEGDNYTGLNEVTTTFDVIPQTNYWKITPNVVSWKYGEYDGIANAISAEPAYGTASVSVYRLTDDGYEEVDIDLLDKLDAGTYYLCAHVDSNSNWTGLNEYIDDITILPSFSILKINNYWQITPNVVSWKYNEYDAEINTVSATPAYGERVVFSIYELKNGAYTLLSFGGETAFELDNGEVPEEVEEVLKNLNAGTYYLRAYVASSVNYTGLNETVSSDDDIRKLTAFEVLPITNSWLKTPNVVGWRYGEYDAEANAVSAEALHGDVSIKIYAERSGEYTEVDLTKVNIADLPAGTYYLCASVAGTTNYTGINEAVTDISTLPSFSVIKVQNRWEDVPALLGWSEGHFDASKNVIVGSALHGEVSFRITDENGNEVDINDLGSLGLGSYVLYAYVSGTDDYTELSATTTFAVFEDSVGLARIITATIIFAVLASGLAVTAIVLLVRRNKKIEREFVRAVRTELNQYNEN